MKYISKEELLREIGEEPIVEDENDKTQIALVLQYRKLIDIINSLPTYTDKQIAKFYSNFTKVSEVVDFLLENEGMNIKIDRKYDYNPYKDTIGYRKFLELQEEKQKQFKEDLNNTTTDDSSGSDFNYIDVTGKKWKYSPIRTIRPSTGMKMVFDRWVEVK